MLRTVFSAPPVELVKNLTIRVLEVDERRLFFNV
jgi:hypothetical protein